MSGTMAIVPAAGAATRMGSGKLLLPFRGSTVLGSCLAALSGGGAERIVVVVGSDSAVARAARGAGAEVAVNPAPERGMLSSVWTGLAALGGATELAASDAALLVCPADLPALDPETVRAVLRAIMSHGGGTRLALPAHAGRRGHPLAIAPVLVAEILALDPTVGLRQLRERHRDAVAIVPVDDRGCVRDVDTPEDYRQLRGETP